MKNEINLKSLLGLSQEEAGMLLGISRVQWAHFIAGRRDLPLAAKIKLSDVLSNIDNNKTFNKETKKIIETEKKKVQDWLHQELMTIKFKEFVLDKKIKKTLQVRAAAFKALEVAHYLESEKVINAVENLASFIQTRAKNTLKKQSLQHFQELEIKKENLVILKSKIEEKLKSQ